MKTTENNKLIAIFMGAEEFVLNEFDLYGCSAMNNLFKDVESDDHDAQHIFHTKEMKFHCSWDWLMPVLQKIGDENNLSLSIEKSFDKAIEHIEWYNKQNH